MPQISARELALQVLRAVDEKSAYANLALNQVLEKYRPGKLDRAFATELTYGTLRSLNTLDWVLARFVKKPLTGQTVILRNILRLGVYQLMFMDRVPPSAVCNEGAEMARRYGHPGSVKFVNGVLRNIARRMSEIRFPEIEQDPVGHISLRYSHPVWLVEKWLKDFGLDETILLCQTDNKPAPSTVRTNTLKITREGLAARLVKEGLTVCETSFAPEGLKISGFLSLNSMAAFQEGLFQVQDESSMLAARAVMPALGSKVLDLCGAPGGKTTHLAQLMDNCGEILSVDIHPHKLKLINDNCVRLGISIVRGISADARNLPEELRGWADFVLVDAPCSGLGVLRRRPDARWRKESGQITALVKLQAEILNTAACCLKEGGVLVYSTCTINQEENLGQIEAFIGRHPDFVPEDLSQLLPAELDLKETMSRGYLQLLPHQQGTDGFFISRMRKRARVEG